MSKEYIYKAAIRFKTDVVVGRNHAKCLSKIKPACEQGFITREGSCYGRFVDRKEALEIAIIAGQKIDKHNPQDELLSEDLYGDDRYYKESEE